MSFLHAEKKTEAMFVRLPPRLMDIVDRAVSATDAVDRSDALRNIIEYWGAYHQPEEQKADTISA